MNLASLGSALRFTSLGIVSFGFVSLCYCKSEVPGPLICRLFHSENGSEWKHSLILLTSLHIPLFYNVISCLSYGAIRLDPTHPTQFLHGFQFSIKFRDQRHKYYRELLNVNLVIYCYHRNSIPNETTDIIYEDEDRVRVINLILLKLIKFSLVGRWT